VKHFLKIPYLLVLLLLANKGVAQRDTTFQLIKTIRNNITDIAVDNLDNLYILTASDQLKKYNAAGDSVSSYNDVRRYGKLHSIDVSNPLKLLLYYKDFSTVVILDRMLSVKSSIDLRRQNILQASAIGQSYDNQIWVFDEYENKLKKINEEGRLMLETPDLRNIFENPILPQQIIDQNNTVYLYDPKNGVFLFDQFGTFRKKIPITNWKGITVRDKYIYGIDNNKAFSFYNTSTLLSTQKALPLLHGAYNYQVANNKLFAWTHDSLHIYNYPF
jgi:hypothetical protein